ncbi:TonB-dependent siderophore receptor [Sphingobium sp. YR768]|uniref:TonB-dependent siderophore receptor n=1 Tax=Sphingobium sp. YR768 TaxID=1884365 RepID=UPI0008D121C3|nr:TonB-dependent siderophore receptor [Sphingobium sp. YR768]SEQ47083.1 iron complex outermembrane recepter protein [Sphingobium sp. YR768]
MTRSHALFILMLSTALPQMALAQAPEAQSGDADILVTGRAEKLYRATDTEIGRGSSDPLDIPQSVQVITSELIRDQGARDITDLYRNVAGISASQYATVTYRGFRQDGNFYDGMRGDPFQGFAVPSLFSIERVEFLKGPVGMLYGASAPGGMINYVTKKPQDEFAASLRGIVGNYDRYGGSGEITGPIDKDGVLTGRAGAFYEHVGTVQRNSDTSSLVLDGGLGVKIGPDTKMTVQLTRYEQDLAGRLRGIPIDEDGNFLADRTWNHLEPSDYMKLNGTVAQMRLDHKASDALSFNLSSRWFRYKEDQDYHEPRPVSDTDGDGVPDTVTREFRRQHRNIEGVTIAANMIAHVQTGPLRHTIAAGGDWYWQQSLFDGVSTRAGVPPLSLTNPVYGLVPVGGYDLSNGSVERSDTRSHRYGLYAQDQIDWGRFTLVGGVRQDWFDDADPVTNTAKTSGKRTSWRTGGIYKPMQRVSLYASYSQSFEPQDPSRQSASVGGPFAPVASRQVEIGAKGELLGGKLQPTIALYRIVRRGIVQVDPDLAPINGVDQMSPIGEVTSKGIELTLAADITRDWVLTANYAYNDARITDSAPGAAIDNSVGGRFPNAPDHQAGFWTRYQIPAIDAAFAFGGQYVSGQLARSGAHMKGFTVFDGSVTKGLGFADLMIRIENIFDKTYATSAFDARRGAFVGRARTVFAELRVNL